MLVGASSQTAIERDAASSSGVNLGHVTFLVRRTHPSRRRRRGRECYNASDERTDGVGLVAPAGFAAAAANEETTRQQHEREREKRRSRAHLHARRVARRRSARRRPR